MGRLAWGPLTIRVRLGAALVAALLPVLALGVAESILTFRHDAEERRTSLIAAAEHSAAAARVRLQSAEALLGALDLEAAGPQCPARLAQAMSRSPGFTNLFRVDAAARISCAARPTGADSRRRGSDWFEALRNGERAVVTVVDAGPYAAAPSVMIAVRSADPGGFDGALAAIAPLDAFKPDLSDRSLPQGAEVALVDCGGRYLLRTAPEVFAASPKDVLPGAQAGPRGEAAAAPKALRARAANGSSRLFAAGTLLNGVTVVFSAPDQGLFSWARLNPLTGIFLPFAAFAGAFLAVWVVADRVIVQWLRYLDRIAAIYARGRFTVRPLQAERAPPELRALAHTLDVMAEAIAGRDHALRDNLAQKDALMREIHHRVKNNLQVITSMLNMQQRGLTDVSARGAISDTRQRIGALALIYRALYQGPDLKRVDLRQFLEELTAQIISTEVDNSAPVRTDFKADELVVDPDRLAPISLFAVEAISNALKHGLGPEGGVLQVRFILNGDEGRLEISDNGGRGGSPEVTEGVSRTLMTAFARQLRGRCDITQNLRGGMTARLVFPVPVNKPLPARQSKGFEAA